MLHFSHKAFGLREIPRFGGFRFYTNLLILFFTSHNSLALTFPRQRNNRFESSNRICDSIAVESLKESNL